MSNISMDQQTARSKGRKNGTVDGSGGVSGGFGKTFDMEKVLRLLGAKKGRRVPAASLRRVDAMAEKVQGMIRPQLGFRIMRISSRDRSGIELIDGTRFKSPKLSKALDSARSVCCFIATIGPVIDLEVQRLMQKRHYSDAYILDAVGSMAAEDVVEQFYRRMARRQAETDAGVTLRFSPGYCDWHLQAQRPLFELFGALDAPDVTLSDSCLMTPRKSVSGVFGLLPPGKKGVHPAYNPCNTCNQRSCIARRSN